MGKDKSTSNSGVQKALLLPEDFLSEIRQAVRDEVKHIIRIEKLPTKPDPMDDLMTRQEVADYFDISFPTLLKWSRSGRLPVPVRIGRRVYYRRTDIEKRVNVGTKLS